MKKRKLTRILIVLLAVSAMCVIQGCGGGGGGGGDGVTTAEATVAAQTVAGAWNLAFGNHAAWTVVGSAVSFAAPGLSLSGTVSTSGATQTFDLALTLSSYADAATGYMASGTIDCSFVVDTSTGSGSGTAAVSVRCSGGPVSTQTWDVTRSSPGPGTLTSYAGTVMCNGTSFDANTLSISRTSDAQAALQSVFWGIDSLMTSQGSWVPGTGNDVSFSAPDVSMTGTKTGTDPTIYALTISFTDSVDTQYGYARSGTVDFTIAEMTSGSITSGSLTGTMALSGSPGEA